jgi:hypothetical protein
MKPRSLVLYIVHFSPTVRESQLLTLNAITQEAHKLEFVKCNPHVGNSFNRNSSFLDVNSTSYVCTANLGSKTVARKVLAESLLGLFLNRRYYLHVTYQYFK